MKKLISAVLSLTLAACLLAVPMAMNPSSIFAVILLLMGGGLLVAGALFLALGAVLWQAGVRHYRSCGA